MLMINGKFQRESPVTIQNVKPQKPPEPEKKAVIEPKSRWGGVQAYSVDGGKRKSLDPKKKIEPKFQQIDLTREKLKKLVDLTDELKKEAANMESKPVETAALDVKPKKEKPKKRPVHGVETRHRTRN